MTKNAKSMWVVAAAILLRPMIGLAEEPGRGGLEILAGVPVYEHRFAVNGVDARTLTVGDSVRVAQQLGIGYESSDGLQLGLSAQFIEAVTMPNPEYPSRLTGIRIMPGASFKVLDSFWIGLNAMFAVRDEGVAQFGFGLQPRVRAQSDLGGGVSLILEVQAPIFVAPEVRIGIQPMLGIIWQDKPTPTFSHP